MSEQTTKPKRIFSEQAIANIRAGVERRRSYAGENNPNFNREYSKEALEKMCNAKLGKSLKESHKVKISKATSGENNPFFGKKHSEETKEKQRLVKLGKKRTKEKEKTPTYFL